MDNVLSTPSSKGNLHVICIFKASPLFLIFSYEETKKISNLNMEVNKLSWTTDHEHLE